MNCGRITMGLSSEQAFIQQSMLDVLTVFPNNFADVLSCACLDTGR
jgi:hypothetical protein